MNLPRCTWLLLLLAASGCLLDTTAARAEQPAERPAEESADDGLFNLRISTLGGQQFWADVRFFHGWHIQRNAVTDHHRLLDADEQRHAWGTLEQCEQALADIRTEHKLPAMQGRAVILLHGLFRTRGSMETLDEYLAKHGDYTVFRLGYPSTRDDLDEHAKALAEVIAHLDGITQIDLVAHSLGNLVIRRYLAMNVDPRTGRQGDARLGRIVMLAPPNHGSTVGERLIPVDITGLFVGEAAQTLAGDWKALERKLVTPRVEFGILAGGKGDGRGYNPLLEGDDDGIVGVSSTRLAGAADFRVIESLHSFIMSNDEAMRLTLNFLEHGAFDPKQGPRPLPGGKR